MAYKRDVADVISTYATGTYDSISDFYQLVVDEGNSAYRSTNSDCLDDVFAVTPTMNVTSCPVIWQQGRLLLYSQYTESQMILAFELFGYEYELFKGSCDDNGGCLCDNRNFNGRNIISKRKFGVLTDNGYLDSLYSREYLMQLKYDEGEKCIYISDEHSKVNPPADTSYLTLDPQFYRKKLIMTYVGFDTDNAQFVEQIVLDKGHETDGIWKYELSDIECNIHNYNCEEAVTGEVDNMTVIVGYVNDWGILSETQVTYPVVYVRRINLENGKVKLDGIYRTYYFDIPYLSEMFTSGTYNNIGTFPKGFIGYFEYVNTEGELIQEYRQFNEDTIINYTSATITATSSANVGNYDMNVNDDKRDFAEIFTTVVSGIDYLKNLGVFRNVINSDSSSLIDGYVAEDVHLITYNLRANIIDSIEGCELPCEKFSYDTWIALMQKKMAASIAFCNNNTQEAARIMSTVEERCKNCD